MGICPAPIAVMQVFRRRVHAVVALVQLVVNEPDFLGALLGTQDVQVASQGLALRVLLGKGLDNGTGLAGKQPRKGGGECRQGRTLGSNRYGQGPQGGFGGCIAGGGAGLQRLPQGSGIGLRAHRGVGW